MMDDAAHHMTLLSDETHRLAPWRRAVELALDTVDFDQVARAAFDLLTEGLTYDWGLLFEHATALAPKAAAHSVADRCEIVATLVRRRIEQEASR